MLTNEPRTVDEAYSSACTTSDLRVEEDRRSDADLLIAAGWNESRVGGALLRLVSEWHGVPKPTKPTRRQIAAMAEDLFRQSKGKDKSLKACSAQATDSAWEWYSDELERVASRLRTLPAVRAQVAHRAKLWSIEPADTVAMQAIGWWLIQRCETCKGTQWQLVQGSNRQSDRSCPTCKGTGEMELPHGPTTMRLAVYMEVCISNYRQHLKDWKDRVQDAKAFVSPRRS